MKLKLIPTNEIVEVKNECFALRLIEQGKAIPAPVEKKPVEKKTVKKGKGE